MKEYFNEMFNGSGVYIIGQVIGIIAMLEAFLIFQQNTHKRIIAFKMIGDILYAISYFMISAYSGGAINLVAVFRETVAYNNDKKWAKSKIWPILFVAFTWISAIITWEGFISAFPALGTSIAVIGFFGKSAKTTRLFNLPANFLWITYSICSHSIGAIIGTTLTISSLVISIIRFDILKKDIKKSA